MKGASFAGVTESGSAQIVSIEFKTPSCKWLDMTRLELRDDSRSGTLILAYSYSTNFCCSWCPSCVRSCFACCPFDDWNKNEAHIEACMEVMASGLGVDHAEEFAARGGDLEDLMDLVTFTKSGKVVSPKGAADQVAHAASSSEDSGSASGSRSRRRGKSTRSSSSSS